MATPIAVVQAGCGRGVSYVDAGVVHIIKRQREGWSYVRP